jgi:hypothetical protein
VWAQLPVRKLRGKDKSLALPGTEPWFLGLTAGNLVPYRPGTLKAHTGDESVF